MIFTYAAISRLTWNDLLAELPTSYVPPLTVHLPVQPVHSPDFVQVDCALNAVRRRVYPKISHYETQRYEEVKKLPLWLVQFALDDPPFVPDYRRTRLALTEKHFPVAQAEYFARNWWYRFEYACTPTTDETQTLVCIRCRVKNEDAAPRRAHVRAKVNIQRECDVFNFHYVPFHWDATNWKPCDLVRLRGDQLVTAHGQFGRVVADGFACAWKEMEQFTEADYNQQLNGGSPHVMIPSLRFTHLDHVLHFTGDIEPGQEAQFSLLLLADVEGVTEAHLQILRDTDPNRCRDQALDHFRSHLPADRTELVFPTQRWEDIFSAVQLSTLQLLVQFPGENNLMPTQGGSSERHLVWVWEALWMLAPMLRLGYTEPVRRALNFIFTLQDGGYAPEGRLTGTAGAVGTTGPRWLCTTGAALALAADYYFHTRDENFLNAYRSRIHRAADWIARELRATRRLNADGSRPPWYGLMPFGCGTDGDVGYIVAFTDAYTFHGLNKTVQMLEAAGDARAGEFRRILEEYRGDLAKTIEALTRPDGRIERAIRTGDKDEVLYRGFEDLVNAAHLAYCGVLPVESAAFGNFMTYVEEHTADGLFMGPMDREVMYLGLSEMVWQDLYLRLGHWKKAFAAVYTNLRYGMTPDTFLVQERFSKTAPEFTPWQPNGSGNGRVLSMILNSLYFEHDGVVTLLGNIPPGWLRRNGVTALRNLVTPRGGVTLEVTADSNAGDTFQLRLLAPRSGGLPPRVRFPEHFRLTAIANARPLHTPPTEFQLESNATEANFILHTEPSA